MLYLLGRSALSDFKIQRYLDQLQHSSLQSLEAHYVYLVDFDESLTDMEIRRCCRLLRAEPQFIIPASVIWVIPRVGTLSPWSSKAIDILHHCDLMKVNRIERCVLYALGNKNHSSLTREEKQQLASLLHDRMTESVVYSIDELDALFFQSTPKPFQPIDILANGRPALENANREWGFALSDMEIDYLMACFKKLNRNPHDVELMMFAQINSEHCRHKIFNADWTIDNAKQDHSLFSMIRNTYEQHDEGVLSAYQDNAAVITGAQSERFFADPTTHHYAYSSEDIHIVMKVETHNHPTAIAPFPGAATGTGGEIRDEAATGRGAKTKAGLVGFSVSNLRIPDFTHAWEQHEGKPSTIASSLDIMLEGPIGAAAFGNEFGRPALCGYFRTYEQEVSGPQGMHWRGYHKPIMIAGGLGNIRDTHIHKKDLPVKAQIIVLGGPAMQIGLGGGAASSMASGQSSAELDFASVQRSNPEMQRRCQEVIDHCWALGEDNPILSIHDVGAGGLSNAIPEIIHASARGGRFELRAIPLGEPGMSPLAIWCNEAQERYVLAIHETDVDLFTRIAERERCPFALVGEAIEESRLTVGDGYFDNTPIDVSTDLLFGNAPKMLREAHHEPFHKEEFVTEHLDLYEASQRILQLPAVASKNFLITIGDRSVGGLTARDQMIGPWQVPVSDVAVTASSFTSYHGEAMAMGERTPVALLHAAASGRLAVGEAITNIAAAPIDDISNIKLSANWMAAAGDSNEEVNLFDTVKAVGMELCPQLGITIPVGKDSLSMRTVWQEEDAEKNIQSPLSLIISAFAPVTDVRHSLTPELQCDNEKTDLILIDLGKGANRLGASALTQVFQQIGHHPADLDDPDMLTHFFSAIQKLNKKDLILAYHDRSDGGLFVTICEMAFASHTGVTIDVTSLGDDVVANLFTEELGAVIQIHRTDRDNVLQCLKDHGLSHHSHVIGELNKDDDIIFKFNKKIVLKEQRIAWQRCWSETSYRMQALRDNPETAKQEFESLSNEDDAGLHVKLNFDLNEKFNFPIMKTQRPKVAILREQGVNGQLEMAAAFDRAGFTAIDVHMSDIINGHKNLSEFTGLAACGGFSYGDALGAGRGWAGTVLFNKRVKDEFTKFFECDNTFTIGVCNGCQMLSQLAPLIPGADHWPQFLKNTSEQYEARYCLVEVVSSPSILLKGMEGSIIPIVVSHGEGRAAWSSDSELEESVKKHIVCLRYVDNNEYGTELYPANPNGSPFGITGLTTQDGRVTIMMPHPERVFRTLQNSWHPREWNEDGAWMRVFYNARKWIGS